MAAGAAAACALAVLAVAGHVLDRPSLPTALGSAAPAAVTAHRPSTPSVHGTDLRITLWPRGPGGAARSWHLACPSRGRACTVARTRAATLRAGATGAACTALGRGDGEALVLGTLGGRPVDTWLDQRDSCDAAAWARLHALLRPPTR